MNALVATAKTQR